MLIAVCALLLFGFPDVGASQAPEKQKPSGVARVSATAVSLSLGLGIGHFMLGYSKQGRAFGITQLAGLASGVAGIAIGLSAWNSHDSGLKDVIAAPLLFGGLALYAGSRVWELVDVIVRSGADRQSNDKSMNAEEASSIEVTPFVQAEHSGVALRFRF